MKKLFCLMLALALLMTASLALAEEAADVREPSESPSVFFGSDRMQAREVFNSTWSVSFSYSDKPEWESRTLADGREVNIMVLAAVPGNSEYQMPMTARLYFVEGKLAAAVEEINLPEASDTARFVESVNTVMRTTAVPLDLNKAQNAVELFGDDARLENGQDAWTYSVYVSTDLNSEGQRPVVNAVMTLLAADDKLYIAQFPYGTAVETKVSAGKDLTEMEGYDKLTEEEKNAVQMYAEFLQRQQNETLAQYIDFLLKKHQ